jgi:DNA-binding response OmpR family regulator
MKKQKKILIATDAEKSAFFSVMFQNLGFAVETAADGQGAFEKVRKTVPDLIMASTVLPKLSGWELLAKVKGDAAFSLIPVMLISDAADVKDKVAAFEQGAEEYIESPFRFPEILARVQSLLRAREILNQLQVRESRLLLAETLFHDCKETIALFLKNMDNLEGAVGLARNKAMDEKPLSPATDLADEKIAEARSVAAGLAARIDKTIHEWDELKKDEIAVSVFERNAKQG